jgi:EmrB/QacA subfamily drug resistance transporter
MSEESVARPGSPGPAHPAIEVSTRAKFEILGAVLLGMFLGALDQTIVGPVLPHIATDLKGADYYTWVVTAYLLTSTVSIPVYSKLSDVFGRKPMLLAGIGLFLVGSALSGLSQTMWQLIAFRGLQGLGAGALFPISLAIIGDLFTPAERAKYQGLFGAVFGVASLVGPFAGGMLTDNLSWNWIFYVNLPLGLVSLYLIWHLLPTVRQTGARFNLDTAGVVTMALTIVPILIALTLAQDGDWAAPGVVAGFAIGLVSLLAFLFAETRAEDPVIPLGLFRNRTFAVSGAATFFSSFAFGVLIILLPLWFQVVQGASSTASGYALMPFLLGLIVSSVVTGIIVSRTGRYKLLTIGGAVVLAVGLVFFTNLRADTPTPVLWAWMLVAGVGVGPTMTVFTVIVQNAVPFKFMGTATGDLTLMRQIGTSVGLSIAFTVFRNNLSWDLLRTQVIAAGAPGSVMPATPPPGFDMGSLTSVGGGSSGGFGQFVSQIPAQFQLALVDGFHQAFSIALANSMWIVVGAGVLSLGASLLLKELPLKTTSGAQDAEAHLNRIAAEAVEP